MKFYMTCRVKFYVSHVRVPNQSITGNFFIPYNLKKIMFNDVELSSHTIHSLNYIYIFLLFMKDIMESVVTIGFLVKEMTIFCLF